MSTRQVKRRLKVAPTEAQKLKESLGQKVLELEKARAEKEAFELELASFRDHVRELQKERRESAPALERCEARRDALEWALVLAQEIVRRQNAVICNFQPGDSLALAG